MSAATENEKAAEERPPGAGPERDKVPATQSPGTDPKTGLPTTSTRVNPSTGATEIVDTSDGSVQQMDPETGLPIPSQGAGGKEAQEKHQQLKNAQEAEAEKNKQEAQAAAALGLGPPVLEAPLPPGYEKPCPSMQLSTLNGWKLLLTGPAGVPLGICG